MKRLEFAHALLKRRLTDGHVHLEIRDTCGFEARGSQPVNLVEPLHGKSADRLIESVENLARRIIHTVGKDHARIVTSPITFTTVDTRITILEFKEI